VRDYRFGLMRDLMDRENLDALAFSADFLELATNFATDVQFWERSIVCVIPRNGEPFAVLASFPPTIGATPSKTNASGH
jgi:hypothetical protein